MYNTTASSSDMALLFLVLDVPGGVSSGEPVLNVVQSYCLMKHYLVAKDDSDSHGGVNPHLPVDRDSVAVQRHTWCHNLRRGSGTIVIARA
jgi:hypothetical protein